MKLKHVLHMTIVLMIIQVFPQNAEETRDITQVLEDFQVNENMGNVAQENPAIAVDKNGNFVVIWEDKRNGNYDIYCQRFAGNGSPQGVNFKVNDDASSNQQDDLPGFRNGGRCNNQYSLYDYKRRGERG